MLPTSPEFKDIVTRNNRSSVALVVFSVSDVTAPEDAEPYTDDKQPFTSEEGLAIDGLREPEFKVGTFEKDYFRLDGSFCFLPDDASPTDKIGWWSGSMSNSSGLFSVNPVLTITFDSLHSSLGIGLYFGTNSSYCSQFNISWYRDDTLLDSMSIIDNDNKDCNVTNSIENYNKVVVEFVKTVKPYRYIRLMGIVFGLEEVFDSGDLVAASVIEEVDPSSSVLTVNKLKFTVMNTNQRFNMLNPEGIYAFLQQRQEIVAQSGFRLDSGENEYVPMGTYYLSDWKNSTSLTATLEATDVIGLLDKTTYRSSPFWVDEDIETVLTHILEDAGNFKLSILPSAASEIINGYIPVKSHRQALADVLITTKCTLRTDRDNTIVVMKPDYSVLDSVDNNNIIGQPVIEQKRIITSVAVKEYTYSIAPADTEISKSTFELIGTQLIHVDFGKAVYNPSVTVSGLGSIVGTPKYSAVSVELTISGTGSLTLLVTGKEYLESGRTITVNLPVLPAGEVPQVASVGDNKLIVNNGTEVANNLLDYYQKRIKQKFDFWANPALQAGDCIEVETMFGVPFSGIVERQEITFAPKLTARLEVTGNG